MVQKIHPWGVIWVSSSRHPVVFLAPLNSPMRRPSIKKSVSKYATRSSMFFDRNPVMTLIKVCISIKQMSSNKSTNFDHLLRFLIKAKLFKKRVTWPAHWPISDELWSLHNISGATYLMTSHVSSALWTLQEKITCPTSQKQIEVWTKSIIK